MTTEENTKVFIPSNPEDLKAIAAVIDDICNLKAMAKAGALTIKEAKKGLTEKYEVDAKAITLMINLREQEAAGSNSAAEDYFETQDEYYTMYMKLFSLNQTQDAE